MLAMTLLATVGHAADCSTDCREPPRQVPQKPKPKPMPKPDDCCVPCWFHHGCSQEYGFYLTADFLWWRTENHGYSFAFDQQDSLANIGKVQRINPKWDPGFRVGLGWNSDYDGWDVLFNWTWMYNHAKTTRIRNDLTVAEITTQGYYPQWPITSTLLQNSTNLPLLASGHFNFRQVDAKSNIHLNAIDFELGRSFYATRRFSLRPHWGVRGAFIDQKFSNVFSDPLINPVALARLLGTQPAFAFDGKNNWWGVGPRAGMFSEWHLCSGFSILGKAAGALMYGQTRVSSVTQTVPFLTDTYVVIRKASEHFDQLVPNLQMMLGLQWGTCFNCDSMYFGMNVCWETNYWWNQFNLPASVDLFDAPLPSIGNQPLTQEGLTINLELDF